MLEPSHQPQLHALLQGLYNPASPQYHHWLRPGQFAAMFGPSESALAATESWLESAGLSPTHTSGFTVEVSASERQVAAALGTSFQQYRAPSGHVGYLAQQSPLVPQSLATGQIAAFLGLDTVSQYQPLLDRPASGTTGASGGTPEPDSDGPTPCPAASTEAADNNAYTLDELGADYGIDSLLADGLNGHGETIGLYELADYSGTDVTDYLSCFDLANAVSAVSVDGGGTASSSGTAEADLDIEQAATQAPGAAIVAYQGPETIDGEYGVWDTIVSDDAAQVVSTSWGECEIEAESDGTQGAYTALFQQAASQGQTILVASGDAGSEGCYPYDGSTEAEVIYPASDPWVTAVGGTSLTDTGEVAWNSCQNDESTTCANEQLAGAGGGGMSRYESRPSYQPNILQWNSAQPCGTSCREVPDLSANAGVGMVVYVNGSWTWGVGTSFAAPLMAGLVADKDEGCSSLTGLWAQPLYALYDQGAYGTAFNEITSGNTDLTGSNDGAYPAGPGYNAAAGIGSPMAEGLSCPEVDSVQPASTYPGAEVTVTGLGLEQATFSFGGNDAQVVSATATQATVVVPAGSGTVTVSASGSMGSGTADSQFTYVPPPAPTGVDAAPGVDAVTVSWTAVAGASSYQVFDATQSGAENYGAAACTTTGTSCTVGDLTGATQYFFDVETVAGGLTSTPSSEVSATPTPSVPTVAVEGPNDSLWLYWQTSDAQWHGPLGVGAPGSDYSAPSIAIGSDGLPTVAVEGPHNSLWLYWQAANAQWYGPLGVGGPGSDYSAPSIAIGPGGLPTVAVEGPNDSLWLYWQATNAQWYGPLGVGAPGSDYSAPSLAFSPSGQPTIATEGPSDSLWAFWQAANAQWYGPLGVGGPGSDFSAPSLAFAPNGLPTVAAEGSGSSLWLYWQTPDAQWHGPLGVGSARSAPSLDFGPGGLPTVAVEGPTDTLWLYWQTPDAQWNGPLGIGGGGSTYAAPSNVYS